MITPDTNAYQSPTIHAEVQAAKQWERGDVRQVVKEAFLRKLVGQELKQNEQQGITSSITITDAKNGRVIYGNNQETPHFAASVNKVPVALLALEDLRSEKLDLNQMVMWQAEDRREGLGIFDQADSPLQAPLRDVLYDMLNRSGNTAVRLVVNQGLGGAAAVNDRWSAYPELAHTRLQPLDATRFYLGDSTTSDALWALTTLLHKDDAYSAFMKDALSNNIYTDYGVRSQLAGNDYIVLANKVGILDDAEGNNRHDVGLIYNTKTRASYGYALFTTAPYNETDPAATVQAEQSLQDVGRYLLRFAGDRRTQ